MLTRWRSMGDVYILCGVYEGYTPGVGVLWEMYTGCWQSLGDVYSVGGLGMCIGCWRSMGMYPGCWLSLGGCTQGVGSL